MGVSFISGDIKDQHFIQIYCRLVFERLISKYIYMGIDLYMAHDDYIDMSIHVSVSGDNIYIYTCTRWCLERSDERSWGVSEP